MAQRRNDCQCYLDYHNIDEMCDPCREKHLDRLVDHHEFMRESARDEAILHQFVERNPGIFAEV